VANEPAPSDVAAETSVTTAVPENLAGRVAAGVGWNVFSQIVIQLTRVVVGVALARLLTPHEVGIAGMALVFSGLALIFTDLSLGAALVQRPQISEADRSTVFWSTFAIGAATTALCAGISPFVADFFGEPRVARLFAVLAITFTFSGIGVTQVSLLTRDFAYRTLQIRGMIAAVVGAAAAVAIAALGYGAWAIIWQTLLTTAVTTILVWQASSWRPHRIYSVESLRNVGGFGLKLFASRLLAYANLNADNLLVGRFLGAPALGVYSLAYNTMFAPMLRFGIPIQQAVVPGLSRLQHDRERLAAALLRSKRLAAAVLAPAFFGILVVAPDLVRVVFGSRWHAVTPVLELLCVAGVAHVLVTLHWSALQALGKAGALLRLNVLATFVIVGAFAFGLRWGTVGVAGLFAAAKWLLVVPDTWVTSRAVGMRTRDGLLAGGRSVAVSAAMAVATVGVRLLLVRAGVPAAPRLAITIAFGIVAYPVLTRLAMPSLLSEIVELVRRRRPISPPAPTAN
jgi:O-antigen/teichoic acid export membrane protein